MALDVLIVDDSAVMRRMILKAIRLSGIPLGTVHEASNGREALDVLEHSGVSVALVDLNMPVMDGIELIDTIRATEHLADLPIIVVSTEGSEARLARVRKHGVARIRKPFAPEHLVDAVVGAIGGANGTRAELGTASGSGPDF